MWQNKKQGKQDDPSQFRSQVDALGLRIVEVTADGNCFFRSALMLNIHRQLLLFVSCLVVEYHSSANSHVPSIHCISVINLDLDLYTLPIFPSRMSESQWTSCLQYNESVVWKSSFYSFNICIIVLLSRALADQLEGNEEEHQKYRSMVVKHILVWCFGLMEWNYLHNYTSLINWPLLSLNVLIMKVKKKKKKHYGHKLS